MKTRWLAVAALATGLLLRPVSAASPILIPDKAYPIGPPKGIEAKPLALTGAKTIARVEFLQPGRGWERLDVCIPATAKPGDKLPCIINVYGGGYAEKNFGAVRESGQALVDAGYVVVAPDYALQTHAPETLTTWDVANAIRHVRANAETYHVDPERIGICGWSAGGWISQYLGYMGQGDSHRVEAWRERGRGPSGRHPALEPRPIHPRHPCKVQAVVSDWGAGKLVGGSRNTPAPADFLSPDDPPLLTCFGGEPRELGVGSITYLRDLGIAAEPIFLPEVKSTHVPPFTSLAKTADGNKTTWMDAIVAFYDRTLKHPARSDAPQIVWVPGEAASAAVTVELLSVHALYGDGSVHYTVDGSAPTAKSAMYQDPITVKPGQTVKTIAIKPGLPASPIASYTVPALPQPVITTTQTTYSATVGQPFEARFTIDLPVGIKPDAQGLWMISGRIGRAYRPFNPPRIVPWMQIDPKTGILSGVPRAAGVWPVIVGYSLTTDTTGRAVTDQTVADARLIVITVSD